jgi:hypothetical protein
MSFADNLKQLPGVSHLKAIQLMDGDRVVATIEHQAGSVGSLAVYNHLSQIYGAITPEAARKGLEIYAEHVEDARQHPGKHPHVDRLLKFLEEPRTLRVKHVFATGLEDLGIG